MRRMTLALSIALVATTAATARGEVNVDVHIGAPAPIIVAPAPRPVVVAPVPPPVVVAPTPTVVVAPPPMLVVRPQLVAVPGTAVYHVPGAGFNVFVFGGKYYSHHNGVWFVSSGHRGKWTAISAHHVPSPVLAVPVTYYRIPPGHAHRWKDDEGDRHCPPGHAKHGRC